LSSIKGYLQNLLDGLTGPVNDRQTSYLGRMLENSDRLIRMIDDLLDLTRIESGRLELEAGAVDLEACLVEAVEQLRPLASAKRQTLAVSCACGGTVVWADRDRVIQVVVNLGQNAIKFTPERGVITVAAERLGECLARIAVLDTGPGIPAGQAERIFDPFFRAQHRQRSGPKGLGLGLSIVKTLVELQGGTVSAGNHPGGGAEIAFTLPVRSAESVRDSNIGGGGRQILIVDDDPDIRQWLSDRLTAEGYDPRAVADGQEALEAFRAEACAGVILDIGIGPIDGLEVLQRIREADRSTPVVMITASGSRELATRALGLGAQAFLLKPFGAGDLQGVLDTWFARGQEGMRRL
jgi:CheY-like chemotaxis protein